MLIALGRYFDMNSVYQRNQKPFDPDTHDKMWMRGITLLIMVWLLVITSYNWVKADEQRESIHEIDRKLNLMIEHLEVPSSQEG